MNALTAELALALLEAGHISDPKEARQFAEEFFQAHDQAFIITSSNPITPVSRPNRPLPPPEPDADEWLAQTSASSLKGM